MSRVPRNKLLYDGCYCHIISRTIRKEKVFKDSEDFEVFLKLLLLFKEKFNFEIFHYCLMHTHFHLIVKIPSLGLFGKALNQLKSRYIFAFHTKYKLSGPVWRERYKSLLIENEEYLYACGLYIENNPVKAGLVIEAKDWKYSSAGNINGLKEQLIDKYEVTQLPLDFNIKNENEFEQGHVIGSDYFKFQLRKRLR